MIGPLISAPGCLAALKVSHTTADGFLKGLGEDARLLDLHPATSTHMGLVRGHEPETVRLKHAQAIQRKAEQLAGDFDEIYGRESFKPTALVERRWDIPLERPPNHMTRLVLGAADPTFSFADYCLPLGGFLFFAGGEALEMVWEPRLRYRRANAFLPATFDLLQPDGAKFQRTTLPTNVVEAKRFIAEMLEARATPDAAMTGPRAVGAFYDTGHAGSGRAGFNPQNGMFYYSYNILDFAGEGLRLSGLYTSRYFPQSLQPAIHRSCEVFVNPDSKESWARGSVWMANLSLGNLQPDSNFHPEFPQLVYYPGHVVEVRGWPGNMDKMLAMVNGLIRTLVPLAEESLKSGVVRSPQAGTTGSVTREKACVKLIINNPPGIPRTEVSITLKPGGHGMIWQVELGSPSLRPTPDVITVRAYQVRDESTGDELWQYATGEMKTALASLAAGPLNRGPVH